MKKVLFISRLNSTAKEINEQLSSYFQIQLCSENTEVAKSVLRIFCPDLILLNLESFSSSQSQLFFEFTSCCPSVPIIALGTMPEFNVFNQSLKNAVATKLARPCEVDALVETACRVMNLDIKEVRESAATNDESRPKILVIDDNTLLLRTMKNLLQRKYSVFLANSGTQAMLIMGKTKPDLIILDYEMPICNGQQTLEMIRTIEDLRKIPVIFLTGCADREHLEAVIRLKPAGYFLKPPKEADLLTAIEDLLLKSSVQ